eukprot:76083-Prymnesium_polylepis.1
MMASTPAICEWMSLPKVPPKMSRTVLTWWPMWGGSSFALSHAMLRGPTLPDSVTMSRSRSGRPGGMQTTSE